MSSKLEKLTNTSFAKIIDGFGRAKQEKLQDYFRRELNKKNEEFLSCEIEQLNKIRGEASIYKYLIEQIEYLLKK